MNTLRRRVHALHGPSVASGPATRGTSTMRHASTASHRRAVLTREALLAASSWWIALAGVELWRSAWRLDVALDPLFLAALVLAALLSARMTRSLRPYRALHAIALVFAVMAVQLMLIVAWSLAVVVALA